MLAFCCYEVKAELDGSIGYKQGLFDMIKYTLFSSELVFRQKTSSNTNFVEYLQKESTMIQVRFLRKLSSYGYLASEIRQVQHFLMNLLTLGTLMNCVLLQQNNLYLN